MFRFFRTDFCNFSDFVTVRSKILCTVGEVGAQGPREGRGIERPHTVRNGLDELFFPNRKFDLILSPGLVSIGFVLRFWYCSLNLHEFSLGLMKISIFDRGKREPLCGSGSRFPETETKKRFVYLIGFSIPFLTVPWLPQWVPIGPIGAQLGPNWGQLGPNWGPLGPNWGTHTFPHFH